MHALQWLLHVLHGILLQVYMDPSIINAFFEWDLSDHDYMRGRMLKYLHKQFQAALLSTAYKGDNTFGSIRLCVRLSKLQIKLKCLE